MAERFKIENLKEYSKITQEFSLVYYYDKSFDVTDHSYDTVEDAVDKAGDVLKEYKDIKRVHVVYLVTGWEDEYNAETIVEEDIMEIIR